MSYSNTTYRRSQDRRVVSINKISATYFEVLGETGNVYQYDSWTDTCNCKAGQRGSYCYHQRCCQELIAKEQETAKLQAEAIREQVQEFELNQNFVSTPTYKATGMEIVADLRDAGFGVQYIGIIGRAYTLEVFSCGDKVATLKFPINHKEQLGIMFIYSDSKKIVLDIYHNTNPLMSSLQSIFDRQVCEAREALFGF